MKPRSILILAAGQGTRMRSNLPKVLHELAGRPLLGHVLAAARRLNPQRLVVVIGHQAERIEAALAADDITWIHQPEQLGTAHAVKSALPAFDGLEGDLLILSGDHPLIATETLEQFLDEHDRQGRGVTLLSTTIDPPTGYGRVIRDAGGRLARVVEHKDADETERAIQEVNAGIYCVDLTRLPAWLERVNNDNAQGEYYLPDIVPMAIAEGGAGLFHHEDHLSLSGINNRRQLAQLERVFRDRLVGRLMDSGVTFIDPQSCWLAADVKIGRDTVIQANVILGPGVEISTDCRIGPFCEISDSVIGAGSEIKGFCHLDGALLQGPNVVGPYARLRPGSQLRAKARVGNFCEVKKSLIGAGSKINHLSYVGDTDMGAGVNVGAGTITCNYDGFNKHRTEIGDRVFIGSDTQLVAPVRVGAGAVIAAGTTVTKPVPENALAMARTPQRHIAGYAKARQQRKKG